MPVSVPVAPDQSATWQLQGSADNPTTGAVLLAAQLGANERMAAITASVKTPDDLYTKHGFGAVNPDSGEFVLHADEGGTPIALEIDPSTANEVRLVWTGDAGTGTFYACLSFNLQVE